jgi:hypothetical protein
MLYNAIVLNECESPIGMRGFPMFRCHRVEELSNMHKVDV